jgi:RecA/RadA recombinase
MRPPKPAAPAAKEKIKPGASVVEKKGAKTVADEIAEKGKGKKAAAAKAEATAIAVETSSAIITSPKTTYVKVPAALLSQAYADLCAEIDKVEHSTGISTTSLSSAGFVKNAISSGCLMYDFVSGGGVAPGRFTITPGREGSGKSTLTDFLAATCVLQGVPIYWFDAETALSPDYAAKIFGKFGLRFADLLGTRDVKNPKKWAIPPVIRYSDDAIGEHVFKTMHHVMKILPTVRQDAQGNWWKLVETKNRKEWVEDPTGGKPQFLFIIDSCPALLPESIDENPDKSPMAVQARMFSDNLKLVKSLLAQKNCIMFATNQLRLNPGARMGDPTYEPGGEALKFYSDNRTRIMRISPNTAGVPSGSGAKYSEEPGLNGGVDQYVYSKIQNVKNKAFAPYRESMFRIRFQKDGAPGDGICETWDCASLMQATGQMLQRGNTMSLFMRPDREKGKPFQGFTDGQKINRQEFKRLVEDPKYKRAIYMHLLRQIRSGYAFQLEREATSRLIAAGGEEKALVGASDDGLEA